MIAPEPISEIDYSNLLVLRAEIGLHSNQPVEHVNGTVEVRVVNY